MQHFSFVRVFFCLASVLLCIASLFATHLIIKCVFSFRFLALCFLYLHHSCTMFRPSLCFWLCIVFTPAAVLWLYGFWPQSATVPWTQQRSRKAIGVSAHHLKAWLLQSKDEHAADIKDENIPQHSHSDPLLAATAEVCVPWRGLTAACHYTWGFTPLRWANTKSQRSPVTKKWRRSEDDCVS